MKLTQEILNELLRYDPETGKLYWKVRDIKWFNLSSKHTPKHVCDKWNAKHANQEALIVEKDGYRTGTILKKRVRAHRIIWCMVFGYYPKYDIDHIDRDRSNNKLLNLREATRSQNNQNMDRRIDNTSGHKGVSWCKITQKWYAYINYNKKREILGHFTSIDDAIKVRKTREKELYEGFVFGL